MLRVLCFSFSQPTLPTVVKRVQHSDPLFCLGACFTLPGDKSTGVGNFDDCKYLMASIEQRPVITPDTSIKLEIAVLILRLGTHT